MSLSTIFKDHHWLIVIPVLLLAALLAGRQLNSWAFSPDESSEMIAAGARDFGPRTLAGAVEAQNSRATDQAFGWVMIINLWGRLVGWSPIAVRACAWLAGLLSLALVYRVGRSLFTHEAGAIAALLMTASTLFVSYMHVGRTFTLVTLFSILALWGYWRMAIDSGRPARRHLVGLVVGGVGLLYTHYLAALLLLATGLFHLLFLRKDRRWWQVVLFLALVAVTVIPELTVLFRAADAYMSRNTAPLTAAAMVIHILYALTNSLVSLPQRTGPMLLVLLLVALLLLLWRQAHRAHHVGRFLGIVVLLHIFLILVINEVIGVLWYLDRIRYFLVLWPPIALLAGFGIWQLWHRHRRLAEWLLVAFVASGIALILRSGIYLSYAAYDFTLMHLADQALQQQARPGDLLLMEEMGLNAFYQENLHRPRETFSRGSEPEVALQQSAGHERVWLLAGEVDSLVEQRLSQDMRLCSRAVRRKELKLTLFARNEADCT